MLENVRTRYYYNFRIICLTEVRLREMQCTRMTVKLARERTWPVPVDEVEQEFQMHTIRVTVNKTKTQAQTTCYVDSLQWCLQ